MYLEWDMIPSEVTEQNNDSVENNRHNILNYTYLILVMI